MGHKISKEQIDPGVKDHIMSFVGNKNELETSDKSDMVNAINSLIVDRVDNINNITKLANSIGNPITASDNVDEVCDKVNGLLSTFKTNMMNNGVMVEGTDKFKQLIEKLASLASSESKGIQIAEGSISIDPHTTYEFANVNSTHTFNFGSRLSFTPSYIFVRIPDVYCNESNGSGTLSNAIITNMFINDSIGNAFEIFGTTSKLYVDSVNESGFVVKGGTTVNFGYNSAGDYYGKNTMDWYAIGVGEEDTTLRDSLASILQDEGVTVTPEDNLASLITKTDEEFTKKNEEIKNSRLNIICATELPSKVVENQVCLITNSFGKVYIANELSTSTLSEGDVYIKNTTTGYYVTTHIITPVTDTSLNINRIVQIKNGAEEEIDGYVGINGQWVPTKPAEFYLFKQGTGLHSSVGGFEVTQSNGTYSVTTDHIGLVAYAEFSDITILSKNYIDVTGYSTIEVKASSSGYGAFTLTIGSIPIDLSNTEIAIRDISSLSGLQHLEITKGSNYQNQFGNIYYIKLTK